MIEKKLDLLVLASTFPRYTDDAEPRFVYDLCLHLRDKFNITVVVPSFPKALKQEDMDGIRVVRFRYAPNRLETLAYPGAIVSRVYQKKIRALLIPGFMLGLYFTVRKLCKSQKFDAANVHWIIPQGVAASLIKNSVFPPYLLTAHGGDVTMLNKGIIKKLKQRAINNADVLTVVSNTQKHNLEKNYTYNNVIKICSMGCDTYHFNKNKKIKDFYKKYYGISDPVILFVGRLVEKKGIKYIIEALTLKPLKDKPCHLVIIGDGLLKEELHVVSTLLGVSDKVTFLGTRNHIELPVYYANADIFCAPSITADDGDSEGLSLVNIEAAACGIPVISTKMAFDELLIDGETGILIEQKNSEQLADSLAFLLASRETREKMGAAGEQYAQKFAWTNIAKKYEEYLLTIINESKPKYDT